jgi:hypothetical protein
MPHAQPPRRSGRVAERPTADYRLDDPYIQAHVHRPSPRSILQLDGSATVLKVEALAGSNHVTPTADRDGARARTVRRYSSDRVAPQPGEGFGCTGLNRRQPWPRSFDGRTMRPIDVTIGEFRLGGTFRLVYLLLNTTTNPTTKRSKSRRSTTSRRSLSLELLRHRGLHPGASGYREGRPPVWSPRLSATLVTRGIKSPRRSRFPTTTG